MSNDILIERLEDMIYQYAIKANAKCIVDATTIAEAFIALGPKSFVQMTLEMLVENQRFGEELKARGFSIANASKLAKNELQVEAMRIGENGPGAA